VVKGKADAVLCASIFHYREYTVQEAKQYLMDKRSTGKTMIDKINFAKQNGLVPAIIQDSKSGQVVNAGLYE